MKTLIAKSKKPDKKFDSRIDGKKHCFILAERGFGLYKT